MSEKKGGEDSVWKLSFGIPRLLCSASVSLLSERRRVKPPPNHIMDCDRMLCQLFLDRWLNYIVVLLPLTMKTKQGTQQFAAVLIMSCHISCLQNKFNHFTFRASNKICLS